MYNKKLYIINQLLSNSNIFIKQYDIYAFVMQDILSKCEEKILFVSFSLTLIKI